MDEIPHYRNDPAINAATAPELKLYRPKINFGRAGLFCVVHIVCGLIIALLWSCLFRNTEACFARDLFVKFCISTIGLFLLTLRFSFIWLVRVYQHYAKSETRLRCCMTPSCSEYAILAFKKYGAFLGGLKTFGRLLRCHPPGEEDYP